MVDSMRERLERIEDRRLAPWAQRSATATRRHAVENEGRAFDYRTAFQRDRDRIVYSRAFRRLRQKAQAGILPAYEDHRRNRLTHTLEVSQLARTVGRALELNEDLIEAVALGHDLGQPPFGPAGGWALDDLLGGRLDGRGGPGLGDLGGFSSTWQTLRVVDVLERRYSHPGLNLTDAVREGLVKCGPVAAIPPEELEGTRPGRPAPFEVQVVALADRMATALHDLDDALQSGAVEPARVERLAAVRELRRKLARAYPARAARFTKANVLHRGLTHLFVTAAILASRERLEQWAGRHRVRDHRGLARVARVADSEVGDRIGLPAKGERMLAELEGFLDSQVRRGFEPDRIDGRGRRTVLGLVAAYHADPSLLEPHVLLRYKELAGLRYLRDVPRGSLADEVEAHYRREPRYLRVLADYVAGMTDGFALAEHARLLEMAAIPIPSAEQLRRERSGRLPLD
jgi:dGTPase